MKLLANFVNAVGLGLIGFAILRPLTDDFARGASWTALGWGVVGLALHGLSHYILGNLRRKVTP